MFSISRKLKYILILLFTVFCYAVLWNEGSNQSIDCEAELLAYNFPEGSLLLDPILLIDMYNGNCRVSKHQIRIGLLAPTQFENIPNKDFFDIYLYDDSVDVNYYRFYPTRSRRKSVRAMPRISWRRIGSVYIPANIPQYIEFYKRSKMVECRNIDMEREDKSREMDPINAVNVMAKFRDLLLSMDMYPFLVFGTLLGWYRECGLIPHTGDMDFAVLADEYNPKLFDVLYGKEKGFRVTRKFGKPENNFELTVKPLHAGEMSYYPIDLFLMYSNGVNESWMGGTFNDGRRIHFVFPLYNNFCAADLYGHLFWVSCTPETMIQADYGENWHLDHPSEYFGWARTPNARRAGEWEPEELNETVRLFYDPVYDYED